MRDPNATTAIRIRLSYDWIVLLYGLLCVFIQMICKGDWDYFLLVVGAFVFVEVVGVSLYRKLQNGGEGYHVHSGQTLDQETGVGFVVFCMAFDFAILAAISLNFLVDAIRQCAK